MLRENGAGDASSSTWEPAKGLTELRGVDAASAFRDEQTKCPSLTTKRWLEAMPYSHHQFKRWRLLLNAKERAKYKPKLKGTVRDRKVVARVWVKAKTTDPSLQCTGQVKAPAALQGACVSQAPDAQAGGAQG